ncbi:GNAT family N-acetyltransferase, partial [Winogradskyella sp.]|nr:GNAT family N-acetyltransferase [Winogradskyella sp.]
MSYKLRTANIFDINFLSKVIIEAEKSGSDKIGLAKVFNLTESELQNYLIQILDEEVDGCEFSISSFVIAEFNDEPVAAFGGWIENENEDNQPSYILKSNLIGYIFPQEKLMELKKNQEVIKDILIEREPHSHQLEYAYVDSNHRGMGLINKIINELLKIAKEKNPSLKKSQVQVFENNT